MTSATLLTIPSEFRLRIFQLYIPESVTVEFPGRHYSWFVNVRRVSIPPNPRLPLLLICKQSQHDLQAISNPLLQLLVHDIYDFDDWLGHSVFHKTRHFTRIRIHHQYLLNWATKNVETQEKTREWYICNFANGLLRVYGMVKLYRCQVTMETVEGREGILDVTFEVGQAYKKKREWDEKAFSRMLNEGNIT